MYLEYNRIRCAMMEALQAFRVEYQAYNCRYFFSENYENIHIEFMVDSRYYRCIFYTEVLLYEHHEDVYDMTYQRLKREAGPNTVAKSQILH